MTYWHEMPNSRESTSTPPSQTFRYVHGGTSNTASVRGFALSATPNLIATTQGILYRQDLRLEPNGADIFYVTVPYGPLKRETGAYRISFSTKGGSLHIKASKETVARYRVSGSVGATDAPDHKQAIGVHGNEIDGTDIVIPTLKISLHFKYPAGIMSMPQIKHLARCTGKVNSDTFLTFAPGEMLYLGIDGTEGTDIETEVTHDFACNENLQNEIIGGITVIEKKGWHVSWIEFAKAPDSGKPATRPERINIERVYNTIPFGTSLGI